MSEQNLSPAPSARPNRLLENLPGVFQENALHPNAESFLEQFLLPFEEIFFGKGDTSEPGLETVIATLTDLLAPERMREDFLAWFAQWMGLTLASDLSEVKRREFLANMMHYFGRPGTKNSLKELLHFFTDGSADVIEPIIPEFQIGVHSSIGIDTYIEGGPPHVFQVFLTTPSTIAHRGLSAMHGEAAIRTLALRVIEWDKPANTAYELHIVANKNDQHEM